MKATVLKADGHKVELDGSVDEVVACLQALGLSPVQPLAKGVVPGIPNLDGRFPFGPGWGDGLTGPIPVRIVPAEGEELQGCPGVRIIPASTPWNPGPGQPYIWGTAVHRRPRASSRRAFNHRRRRQGVGRYL